jgi:hypothetical protein
MRAGIVCAVAVATLGSSAAIAQPPQPWQRGETSSGPGARTVAPPQGAATRGLVATAQAITPSVRVNSVTDGGQHLPVVTVGPGGQIYVAWVDCPTDQDCTTSNPDIYFAKSTDGGQTFDTRVLVSDDGPDVYANAPKLATDQDGTIYIVWHDNRAATLNDDSWDVYLSKSTNGGLTFSPSVQVSEHIANAYQYEPDLAVTLDGTIYISWQRYAYDGTLFQWDSDVYAAKSTDGGSSVGTNVKVSDGANNQFKATIGVGPSGNVYVAWSDFRDDGYGDVYFARSTDGATTFSPSIRVNNYTSQAQVYPELAVDADEVVYVAWLDGRRSAEGADDVYMARSTDLGLTFGGEIRASDSNLPSDAAANYLYPVVTAAAHGFIAVVWYDNHTGDWDTYMTRSNDAGLTMLPSWRVNDLTANSQSVPDIFMTSNLDVYCVYRDRSSEDFEIYFVRDAAPPAPVASSFHPLTPCRVLDTRDPSDGPVLAAAGLRMFTVVGACGVPAQAKAIVSNLTVVGAEAEGSLKVIGGHLTATTTSSINFTTARARANNAIVQLATDGSGTISVINNSMGTVHFILDVSGYFQ